MFMSYELLKYGNAMVTYGNLVDGMEVLSHALHSAVYSHDDLSNRMRVKFLYAGEGREFRCQSQSWQFQ